MITPLFLCSVFFIFFLNIPDYCFSVVSVEIPQIILHIVTSVTNASKSSEHQPVVWLSASWVWFMGTPPTAIKESADNDKHLAEYLQFECFSLYLWKHRGTPEATLCNKTQSAEREPKASVWLSNGDLITQSQQVSSLHTDYDLSPFPFFLCVDIVKMRVGRAKVQIPE